MSEVLHLVGVFFSYAVLAIFAQNAIFTRGLGVSRLVQLVGDKRTSSWWFALMLCITQVLVAPLAFYAGRLLAPLPNRAQLRPVVYLACIAVVCLFELVVLKLAKGPRSGQLIRILPIAAVNSGVLGTVLVERTQSFTLEQSIGFGLGSGLGYLLAVMLVTEAQNRLRSRAIPEAFRGLPITLIYIGVLALAITVTVMLGMGKLGPTLAVAVILIAQLSAAAAIDAFGIMGTEKLAFGWGKWAGLALMTGGMLLFKMK